MGDETEKFFSELRALRQQMEGVVKFVEKLTPPSADGVLSVKKSRAAAMLDVSVTTLDRMISRKEIRTVQVSGRPMVPMHEMLRVVSLPKKREPEREAPAAKKDSAAEAARLRDWLKSRRRG